MPQTLLKSQSSLHTTETNNYVEDVCLQGAAHTQGGSMLKKEPAIYYGWAVARLELWWTPERVERSKNMRKWQRLWSMLPPLRQHELEVFVYKLRGLGVTEERIGDVLHAAVKSEAQYTSDNELVNILRRRQRRKK